MDDPSYQTLKRIFLEARDLRGEERRAFLDRACAGSAELLGQVEELLAEEDRLDGFLEGPARAEREPESPDTGPGKTPERIGAYRILRVLGWGGMGVVYLAEQEAPRRVVALKVMRCDAASPAELERFEREAELLGGLHHPGIATVYAAGTADTEIGPRPWFAMEYVEGRPLHEYVETEELDLAAKVALVSRIAEAVHYAHERGVVHRDLKPSNVLVDARGQPRVLDFGIARPLGGAAQGSRPTEPGQLVGTLAYMSPEQAAGEAVAGARSDVYSLGVILYELLSARLPIATDQVPLHEAVRRIREEDPIAAGSISRELEGDLDVILLKALEKAPERRYASAADFGEDLRRFLDQRPILARPASAFYQARKLVRRHRGLAAAVGALILALSAALVISLVLLRQKQLLLEQQKLTQNAEKRSSFVYALVERVLWRKEIEEIMLRGQGLLAREDPAVAELESCVKDARRMVSMLDENRAMLAEIESWSRSPSPEGAPATPLVKRGVVEILGEFVHDLERLAELLARMEARLAGARSGVAESRP